MSSRMRPPGRFARAVRGTTRRLEGRELLLGLGVAAVGLLMAWVSWASVNGVPLQDRYELKVEVAPDAPILKDGDAVRIAGRLAGFVTEVEPDGGHVLVTAELRPEFAPIGNDASANVKVRSIVYLTYLELFPGNVDDPMREGGTIPLARSSSGVDLLEVVQLFDRKARLALSDTVRSAGLGFAGRGEYVNAGLRDLGAATGDLATQLEAATAQPGAIASLVGGAARTVRGLRGTRPGDLGDLIGSGSAVVGALAAHEAELGDAVELLRPFEDELLATAPLADPLLDDAAAATTELTPAARELAAALPQVNRVLALGDEIRAETVRLTRHDQPGARRGGAGRPRPSADGRLDQAPARPAARGRRRHRSVCAGHPARRPGDRLGDRQLDPGRPDGPRQPGAPLRAGAHLPPRPRPVPRAGRDAGALAAMLIRKPSLRRRLLGIATLLVVAAGLVVAALRPDPFTDRQTVWAKFDNVNGLGSIDRDIRVAGVNEGEIGAVERVGDDALVELEVNSEIPVHSDAQVALRPHTLFEGSAFVDLHPGSPSAPLIDEGDDDPAAPDPGLRLLRRGPAGAARARPRAAARAGADRRRGDRRRIDRVACSARCGRRPS